MFEILQNGGFSMETGKKGRKSVMLFNLALAIMLGFLSHKAHQEEAKRYYMDTENNTAISDPSQKSEVQEEPGHVERIDTKVNAIKHYLTKEV